jgi:hypothetical protein
MYIVVIGWSYVVLMMGLAEALGPGGSWLGALVTLLLYGVLPVTLVLYIGGARGRAKMRARTRAQAPAAAPASPEADPGGGGQAPGETVAPVREEP